MKPSEDDRGGDDGEVGDDDDDVDNFSNNVVRKITLITGQKNNKIAYNLMFF